MKQGTGVVGELCKDVFIPKMVKVHQKFDLSYIKPEDIPGVVRAQLDRKTGHDDCHYLRQPRRIQYGSYYQDHCIVC